MQRELLQSSSAGAQKHVFAPAVAGGKNMFCGVCAKTIWSISRQGLRCQECGYYAHKSCQALTPACLGRAGCIASLDEVHQVDMPKALCVSDFA
jgi:hypothetical protein